MKTALKILLLEDSKEDAELIRRLLKKEKMDCQFFLAMNKEAFLKGLVEFVPSVILSDQSIPQFNSSDALQVARQKLPGIPFIMVTGAVSEEFAANIIRQGADDYILKDRMARLPAAINAALQQRSALKELTDYKYALDTASIVAITNQQGIIIYANENFSKISKYSMDELIGQNHGIVNSNFHSAAFLKKMWVTVANGKVWQGEICHHAKDKSIYWVSTVIVPFLQPNGRPYQYLTISQDITNRKKAEKELKQSEIRLNEAQAITHISNWEIDLVNNIHRWSDELYRIFGLDKAQTKPSIRLFLSFLQPDNAAAVERLIAESWINVSEAQTEFRFTLKPGKKRYGHIQWRFHRNQAGKPVRVFGILQDITERKEAEENLKLLEVKIQEQKIQEQKKITRAILKGQEKERNYIGQELHDNINQILAGSKMYLSSAAKKDENLFELVKTPLELIDLAIEEIRTLCQKLVMPQKVIELKELIQDLLYNLAEHTAVDTSLTYTIGNTMVADDLKLNIYRIIQELLTNVQKYAAATRIQVVVIADNGFISITVSDDGKGFNTKLHRKGIGISNIIYRAECFGGKVAIKSSPGKGCKTIVKIPY